VTGHLTEVQKPDLGATAQKWQALQRQHAQWAERAWIGTIVMEFTNDELRVLCDQYFTINETLTMRRLGLLQTDEGFDGREANR
jgi:hypothetical protein